MYALHIFTCKESFICGSCLLFVGLILSGFFYGYVLLQIPGGYLATRFSAKYVILCGILIPAILSLIMPLVTALTTNFIPVLAIRILQGAIGVCSNLCIVHMCILIIISKVGVYLMYINQP